jgi:arabinose-5-phosphate isomerase
MNQIIDIAKEVFENEINGMKEVCDKLNESFTNSIELILSTKGRVVITGMGKSGLVGQKITATLSSTGTRSFFMHPAEAYHGDLGMIDSEDVIIAISNSGETSEVLKLLSFFKDNKNKVIALTQNENSTLAKYSDFTINTGISKAACPLKLAPTTSTTVTMAMGDAIAVCLMNKRNFKEENFAKFHPGGSLGKKLLARACDYMQDKNLPIISTEANFQDILSSITSGRMGISVVVDNEKIVGVITDGDIRRAISKHQERALSQNAVDIMTHNPQTIDSSLKLAVAENIMQEKKISNLLVTENDSLVGILSRYDI